MEKYTAESNSLVNPTISCKEVHSGLIPHDALGSIPKCSKARMAKLVDACDLKSHLSGCWFDSSYEQLIDFFFIRKNRIFNKSRYARVRQVARVIFYFSLYINLLIIYGILYFIYGLSIYHGWFWWLIFSVNFMCCIGIFLRSKYYQLKVN